jgi:FkbM family methyltransferase
MRDARATGEAQVIDIRAMLEKIGLTDVAFRPGTSDERVLNEVLFKTPYRRRKIDFDVEAGERWIDLGANIGAFALYCKLRGATAVCFEPDPGCFGILTQNNPPELCNQVAVTHHTGNTVPFWGALSPLDHHRSTAYPMKRSPRHPSGELPNLYGDFLASIEADGCKMDIEGSEGGLLDAGFIPKVKKLVLEYHLWRDPSMANLRRRLDYLKSRFSVVHYPPEFDRMLASGYETNQSYYDRLIFCKV